MDPSNNTKESTDQFNAEKNDCSINEISEDVPFLFHRHSTSTKCMNNKKDDLAQVLAQQGNQHALDRLMLSCLKKETKPKVKKKTVQNVTPLLYIPSENNPSIVAIDKNLFYDLIGSKKPNMMNNGQNVINPRNTKENTNLLLQETSNLNTNIIKEVPVDVLTKKRNKSSPVEIVECNVCKLKFDSRSRLSHHMTVHRRCINTGVRRCRKLANQTNASLIAKIVQENNNMYFLSESPNSLNTCRSNDIDRLQDKRKHSVISSSSDLRLPDERNHSVISSSSDLRLQDKRKHSVISSSSDLRLQDKRKHSIISSSSDLRLQDERNRSVISSSSDLKLQDERNHSVISSTGDLRHQDKRKHSIISSSSDLKLQDERNHSVISSSSDLRHQDKRKHSIISSSSDLRLQDKRKHSVISSSSDLRLQDERKHSVISSSSDPTLLPSSFTVQASVNNSSCNIEDILCEIVGISSLKKANTTCTYTVLSPKTASHVKDYVNGSNKSSKSGGINKSTSQSKVEKHVCESGTADFKALPIFCQKTKSAIHIESHLLDSRDPCPQDVHQNLISAKVNSNKTRGTASNDDPGTQYDDLEQMNTVSETASKDYAGNHDDTLEQMNTLSDTASNNYAGNHDDTLEQMNTLSETASNNYTGNHDDTLEQMNTLSETALKDHMTGKFISNGTREINQNVLTAEQNTNLSMVKEYEANSCCNSDENKCCGRNTLLDNDVITIEDVRKDNSVNKDGRINSHARKNKNKIDNSITVANKVAHGNQNIKNCKESCFIASEIEDNKKKHDTKRKSLRGNKKKEESKTSTSQNDNNKIKHNKRKRCGNEIITAAEVHAPIDWPGYNSVMDSFNTEVYIGTTSLENLYPCIQDLEKNALGILQKLSSQKSPCKGGNPCTQNIPCKRRNLCTQESSCKEENQSGQKSPCKRNHSEMKVAQKDDNQISQAISYIHVGDTNSMQTCPNKESMCNSLNSSCGDNVSTSKIDTDITISCMQDRASPCTNMNDSVKQIKHFCKNEQFQEENESIHNMQKSIEQFNEIDSKEQMEAHPFMVIKSSLDDIPCCGIPHECHVNRDIDSGSKILDENCTRTSCYHDNMRHYKMWKERISYLGTDNLNLNKKGKHVCDSDKHVSDSGKHVCDTDKHVCDTDKHVSDSGKHVCDSDKHTCDSDIQFSDANNHTICDRDTCLRNSVENDLNVDHSNFKDKEQIDISDNHAESSESQDTCSTGKNPVCDNESKDTCRTEKNSVCDNESKDTCRTEKNSVCDKEVETTEGCDLKHPRKDNLTIKTGDDRKLCYSKTVIFIDGTVKERPRINKPESFKKPRYCNNVLDDDCSILHEVTSSSTCSRSLSPRIDYVEQSSPASLKTVNKLQYIKLMNTTGSKERGGNQRKPPDVKNLFSCSNDKKTEYNIYGQIMKSDLSVLSMEHFKCHKDDENLEHVKWQNKKSCVDNLCNSDGGTTFSRDRTCFSDDEYNVVRLKNKGRKKKHISETAADQYIEMKKKCSVQYKDKIKETRKRKADLLFAECSSKKCIKSCNGDKDESYKKKKEENINTLNTCSRKNRTNANRNSEDVLSEKSKITKKVEKNRFLNRKSLRRGQKKNVIKHDRVCKTPRKTGKLEPLKDIVWQNQKKGQNSLKYTKSPEKEILQGSKISRKSQCPAKCKKIVKKDFLVKSQKKKEENHSFSHESPEMVKVRKSPRKLLSKTKSTFECPGCNVEQGCNQGISNVVKLKNIKSKVQREPVLGKGGSKVQRETVLGKGDKSYGLRREISHVHNLKDTLKNNSFTSLKKGKTKTFKIKVDSSKKSSERTNKTVFCDNLRKSPRKVAQNGNNRPQDSLDRSPKFGNNSRQLFPRQHCNKSCIKENKDLVKLQKRLPRKQEGRNNRNSTNKDKNLDKKTKVRKTDLDKELFKIKLFVSAFRNRKKNQKMKLDKTVQGSSTNTKVNKTESETRNMDKSYDKNYHSNVVCNFKTPEKTTETNATVTSEISRINSQGKHTTPKKRWQALFESEVSDYNTANFSGFMEMKKSDTTDMTKTDGKLYNKTDESSYPSDIDVVTMHDDFVKNEQIISSTMCDRQIRSKTDHDINEESDYEDSQLSLGLTCSRFIPYYRVRNSARTLPIGEQC